MTIKEIMKNVEKQNALRKELKQDELEVKFSDKFRTVFVNRTFTTYKDLAKWLRKVYGGNYAEGLLNADFEYADGSFINVGCTIIVK